MWYFFRGLSIPSTARLVASRKQDFSAWARPPIPASAFSSWSEKGVRLAQKYKLAHAFLWEYSYERLELVQLLANVVSFSLGLCGS